MRVLCSLTSLSTLALLLAPGHAQQFNKADNLAPYVPTPQVVVERMLEAARLKPGEVVYDLGCGDGRIIITAVQKFKAKGVGVELSEDLFNQANQRIQALGLEHEIRMIHGNLLNVDLSPADVVTVFLLTSSNARLKPNLEKELRPGARVLSTEFEIRGWKPSQVLKIEAGGRTHTIYLYEIGRKK